MEIKSAQHLKRRWAGDADTESGILKVSADSDLFAPSAQGL